VIPTAVHEALGVVARRYAAQLNNLSASAIRIIGYNEVHERGIIDENEAVCCDERVEPSTGIDAGINSSSRGRGAKEGEGDNKGEPLRKVVDKADIGHWCTSIPYRPIIEFFESVG
jgi:hypothetical protein